MVLLADGGGEKDCAFETCEQVLHGAGRSIALGRKAISEEVRRALAQEQPALAKRWSALRAGRRWAAHPDSCLLSEVAAVLGTTARPWSRARTATTTRSDSSCTWSSSEVPKECVATDSEDEKEARKSLEAQKKELEEQVTQKRVVQQDGVSVEHCFVVGRTCTDSDVPTEMGPTSEV
ncbi:unnamed protein product [Prorocentrum cordatum]|uniref:Uncharacterized protein n=1 Tax=Prorocentrum cordatum TaxID=2364126 RepID=A0ABN9S8M0_9DINO|nr:unnamed protein product [Polarella glacialis]